jgi:hypothetical protein
MPATFRLMFGSNLTQIPANRVIKPMTTFRYPNSLVMMNTTNTTLSKILILHRTALLLLHLREFIGLVSVLKYGLKYDSNTINHCALISLFMSPDESSEALIVLSGISWCQCFIHRMILSSKSLLNRAIESPTVNPIEQYLAKYANRRRLSMRSQSAFFYWKT